MAPRTDNPDKTGVRLWLGALTLMAAVVLAYGPIWRAGFVWDDDLVVTANPVIVGPLGLHEIWTTSAADICPLTLTTFWIEHKLWGLDPLPYHLVNVVLHGASAILLWRVLLSLRVPGAWLGAALWAMHPVQVESVAWISELKNTQSGVFYLLAILFFVKSLKTDSVDSSRRVANYAFALVFAALAMASKSSTVVLPLILALCAWWVEGRLRWQMMAKLSPIFLMSLVAGIVSIWTQSMQRSALADDSPIRYWPERLISAADAICFYLGKLLWPHPLVMIYPAWPIDSGNGISYLVILLALMVSLILWIGRASWSRPWFFAGAYFVIALLPVLGLANTVFSRLSPVADHFQYLASMGPLALAGAGVVRLCEIFRATWLAPTLSVGLLLILGGLSWQRSRVFENMETLCLDTLARNPNCWLAYNNLGDAYSQSGRLDDAIEQYRKALEIKPHYALAHYDWGVALGKQGKVDEAAKQFQAAVDINPNFAEAHYNLGVALVDAGRTNEAMDQFQKAVELDPDNAEAHNNLGNAFLQTGRIHDAVAQFQMAIQLKPDFTKAKVNLAEALALERSQSDHH